MIDRQFIANTGVEAAFIPAGPLLQFLRTLKPVHVGRGTTNIADITAETRMRRQAHRLLQDGGFSPRLHDASLMHGNGAEAAFPIAAAVREKGKLNCFLSLDRSPAMVVRMNVAGKRQCVYAIELLRRQRQRGRILNQIAAAVPLKKSLGAKGITVLIEKVKHAYEGLFIAADLIMGWQFQEVRRGCLGQITNPPDATGVLAGFQRCGKFQNTLIGHPVEKVIRRCITKNGLSDSIGPVVIVRNPPEACLKATQGNGLPWERKGTDQVRISDYGAVRPPVVPAAGGQVVLLTFFLRSRVIRNHGIESAPGYAPEQDWVSQAGNVLNR